MEYLSDTIIPKHEIFRRINLFKDKLLQESIDYALIVSNPSLLYFTGIIQQGFLLINQDSSPIYFVKKDFDLAKKFSNIENIVQLNSIKEIAAHIEPNRKIGFELDILPYNNVKFYDKLFHPENISDITPLIRQTKSIKSDIEIEFIKKAANQLKIMCKKIKPFIKSGVKEYEVFGKIQDILISEGHQGYTRMHGFNQEMFYGHILSGENSLMSGYLDAPSNGLGLYPGFPQGSSDSILKENSIVSVDIVGCYNGYHADQTRAFAIGNPDKDFFDNFKKAVEIQNNVVEYIKPGLTWESAYFKGLDVAEKLKVKDIFMGLTSKAKFIGHGIGVEVDEFPFIAPGFKNKFESGMTFAIEPKIFIPDKGMIGIENTYLLTENGCEKLTTVEDKIIKV